MADQNDREYRPPIMKRIGGVFLLGIGLVVLAFTLYFAAQDFPLWVFGKHTKAEVVEIWVERVGEAQERDEGELKFDFYVRYQFTTPGGRVITKTTKASATEWSGMWEGLLIDVVYFPLFPQLNRLDDSRWILFLSCTYIPLIVVGVIGLRVGWYMLTSP
jgi:hypothetical protein